MEVVIKYWVLKCENHSYLNHHHQSSNISVFLQAICPSGHRANSVKALKTTTENIQGTIATCATHQSTCPVLITANVVGRLLHAAERLTVLCPAVLVESMLLHAAAATYHAHITAQFTAWFLSYGTSINFYMHAHNLRVPHHLTAKNVAPRLVSGCRP